MDEQNAQNEILRQLGGSEVLYEKEIKDLCFLNTRAFLLKSKFDLFSRIDIVDKAISLWKDAHQFLRCRIITDENNRKYFAFVPAHILNNSKNVNYLKFETNDKSLNKTIWKLFLERELSMGIDSNGLLWRLMFIQLDSNYYEHNDRFYYQLVFTANHAIIDGRNAFQILNQLISFIEILFLGKQVQYEKYETMPALDQHPEVIEHKLNSLKNKSTNEAAQNVPFLIPDGILHENYEPFSDFNCNSKGSFLTIDNKIFSTYEDLVQQNKHQFTKLQCLIYEKDKFTKLLNKCKLNGTKLTGCINIITILAMQQLIKHFSGINTPDLIYYATTVSMRAHLNPPIDLYRMGYCSLLFDADYNGYIDIDDNEFWSKKFWQYAKVESDAIHLRLKNRDYIDVVSEDDVHEHAFDSDGSKNSVKLHFVMSNRGDMTDISSSNEKLLEFIETFSGMSFGKNNCVQIFMHTIESLNKKLFWTIGHNKNMIKDEAASYYLNFLNYSLDKITF